MAHRVSVDRRVVERRQIEAGHDIARQHAAERVAQTYLLDLADRLDARRDQPLHLGDRQQRAREGEAIVGELRHHAPPGRRAKAAACASRRSMIAPVSSRPTRGTLACGSATSDAIATIWGSSG